MRKDISRVLTERSKRRGDGQHVDKGRFKEHTRSQIEEASWLGDDSEVTSSPIESINDNYYSRKFMRVNTKPLLKFLSSKVGCNWDAVYSEIREAISTKDTVGTQIINYLKRNVITSASLMEDGSIVAYVPGWSIKQNGYVLNDLSKGISKWEFYVHPITKVLCNVGKHYRRYRPGKRRPSHDTYQISELEQYRRIDSCWFRVQLTRINKEDLWKWPGDQVFKMSGFFGLKNGNRMNPYAEYGAESLRALSKRQCGHKEVSEIYKLIDKHPSNFYPAPIL